MQNRFVEVLELKGNKCKYWILYNFAVKHKFSGLSYTYFLPQKRIFINFPDNIFEWKLLIKSNMYINIIKIRYHTIIFTWIRALKKSLTIYWGVLYFFPWLSLCLSLLLSVYIYIYIYIYSFYRKPTTKNLFVHFKLALQLSAKRNYIRSEIKRIHNRCNEEKDKITHTAHYINTLKNNDYPTSITWHLNKKSRKLHRSPNTCFLIPPHFN